MHCHARPQIPSDPWISHSNLCKSEKFFAKLMQPLNPLAHDLQNLKIASPKWPYAPPKSLDKLRPSPSKLCKSAHYFWKLTTPLDPSTSDLQDPKISGPDDKPRASMHLRHHRRQVHAPPRTSGIISANFMRHLTQPRAQRAKHLHVPSAHDVKDDVILRYPCLTRTNLETWPDLNRLQKKKKKKSFDLVELWLWPKSQNFQNGLVPLNFSSTFRFWDLFLHLELGNRANCPIPKKIDFCTNLDQKVKIFKKYLSCTIFRVDSIFGIYFFIQESEISQIVWFYSCWP